MLKDLCMLDIVTKFEVFDSRSCQEIAQKLNFITKTDETRRSAISS